MKVIEQNVSKGIKLKFVFVLLVSFFSVFGNQEEHDFARSFIDSYGFSSNARDTREYHPFILRTTRESFTALENHLQQKGFILDGRMVVCGYQEDAMPSYYTSCAQGVIDDEVSIKSNIGWQFSSGNRFGFATGFLLKDVNCLHEQLPAGQIVFEHIVPDRIGLFDPYADFFHKHAFGAAYPLLHNAYHHMVKQFANNDIQGVLGLLHDVWKDLYVRGLKDGQGTLIATQDILFSIHYARYLLASKLPLLKFFIGPDITYPIEILPCQKKEATEGAQQFVQRLFGRLQPVDDEKTAYVFCSFVDGVGKSTLLGNLKNWVQYGDSFQNYDRVDNSSSQHPTLFNLKDNVVIADLPAQVSHATAKPDGFVYVDVHTIKNFTQTNLAALQQYVVQNKQKFVTEFDKLLAVIHAQKEKGILSAHSDDASVVAYAKNVCILDCDDVQWIPFSHQGKDYLFNLSIPEKIRMLVSFDVVHSFGLKVVEPEQMLFLKGVSMPLKLDLFLKDLSDQLAASGVQRVVFVDFMSMYPRTSRENIRVNFLLQQLKYVHGDAFVIDKSLYKGMVNPQEIYLLLKQHGAQVENSLVQETMLRWSLHDLLTECADFSTAQITLEEVTPLLQQKTAELYAQHKEHVIRIAREKVVREYDDAIKTCSFDRTFETLVRFDFESLMHFSSLLQNLFGKNVHSDYFATAWRNLDQPLVPEEGDSQVRMLVGGAAVDQLYRFNRECREKIELKEPIAVLRAHWYALISNILDWQYDKERGWQAPEVTMPVVPLVVKPDGAEVVSFIRPQCVPIEQKSIESLFFVGCDSRRERQWGMLAGESHCLDWYGIHTYSDVYSFGYRPRDAQKNMVTRLVNQYKKMYEKEGRSNMFMSTQFLYNCLCQLNMWDTVAQEMSEKKVKRTTPCDKSAAQLFVRMIATLDMILKDLSSEVLVRKGSKEDFTSALLLLEKVTLPAYFGITFKEPLFKDYTAVEPVILWDYIG